MENKTLNQLIKLYEDQITQLEIMSKIELGDGVIEEINKLKSELKNTYTQEEVLQLMYQAFESGFMKYEVVDAGLESMETKEECGWILRRYDSDLAKEKQKQLITEIMNEDAKDGLYKKQTAVEWLIEQLEGDDSKIARVIGLKKYNYLIQQAKEMEKEQKQIELPSDEDIKEYVKSTGYYGHCTHEYHEGIEEGAKWMRDKIQGGNK